MIAGIVTTSTLTSCGDQSFADSRIGGNDNEDCYIIIKQNDSHILHKGDYFLDVDGSAHGFKFNCGEDFVSNAEHFVSPQTPKEDRYDIKCEDCFSLD